MPIRARFPTVPPTHGERLPFRSWVRTASPDDLVRFNASLGPDDGGPASPWEEAIGEIEELDLWVMEPEGADDLIDLATHPDERVVVALVDTLTHDRHAAHRLVSRAALLDRALRSRLAINPAAPVTGLYPYTPIAEALRTLGNYAKARHLNAPIAWEHARRIEQRLLNLSQRDTRDDQAYDSAATDRFIGDVITGDRRLSPAALTTLASLPSLFRRLPFPVIAAAPAAAVEAVAQSAPRLLANFTGWANRDEAQPGAHIAALAPHTRDAVRQASITWIREEIRVQVDDDDSTVSGWPAAMLGQFRLAGLGLTADELHEIIGDVPLDVIDPEFQERGAKRRVGKPPMHAIMLRFPIAALQEAVTAGYDEDLEKIIVASQVEEPLAELLTRIPITPRVAAAAIYAAGGTTVRVVLAADPAVRHLPAIRERLLDSRSADILRPYLVEAPPAEFAHYFRIAARRNPAIALAVAGERWADVNDYMEATDFSVIPDAVQAALGLAPLILTFTRDLAERSRGVIPGPLVFPAPGLPRPRR